MEFGFCTILHNSECKPKVRMMMSLRKLKGGALFNTSNANGKMVLKVMYTNCPKSENSSNSILKQVVEERKW